MKKNTWIWGVAGLCAGVLLGALIVLVTPLRFYNLVEPQINEISASAFYAEFKTSPDNYIFIDVRLHSDYVKGHPEGAINMPLETLYNERHYLPKHGKTIVLTCGSNASSGVGFSYLQHFGFYNIMRMTGGLPAWKAAGLPVVIGEDPYGTSTVKTAPLSFAPKSCGV